MIQCLHSLFLTYFKTHNKLQHIQIGSHKNNTAKRGITVHLIFYKAAFSEITHTDGSVAFGLLKIICLSVSICLSVCLSFFITLLVMAKLQIYCHLCAHRLRDFSSLGHVHSAVVHAQIGTQFYLVVFSLCYQVV